jgi:hypothetical protein
MKYKQKYNTDINSDWSEAIRNSDLNFAELKRINDEHLVNNNSSLLYRYFALPVADGRAYYQVTRVKTKKCVVTRCKGICLDEYADNVLGDECELSLAKTNELVKRQEAIDILFS